MMMMKWSYQMIWIKTKQEKTSAAFDDFFFSKEYDRAAKKTSASKALQK
jgi:hypothetical protein